MNSKKDAPDCGNRIKGFELLENIRKETKKNEG